MPPEAKGLYPALLAVQSEAPTLQKTAINPHFKSRFVPLDKVHEVVMPLLNKHGLAWLTLPGFTEQGPILQYRLSHVQSGEELTGAMLLLPAKSDPQGQGSAITYARRYSLMAVLGLVADEDDDGNAGSKPTVKKAVTGNKGLPNPDDLLADQVAALPGTTELATQTQLTKLVKAKDALGPTRFDAYLRAQGVDGPEELSKDAAESVLTWARTQAKNRTAA